MQKATNSEKYFANHDFRDINLINQLLSNLDFTLQTENTDASKNKILKANEIDLNVISNKNLESIISVKEDTTKNHRNLTWYVYPKKGKEWDVNKQETKNAYFSINFVPPKNNK